MPYATPEGTELIAPIGAGSVFEVALVREAGRALVCKRLRRRVLHEPAGRAAIVREAQFLSLSRHRALPSLERVGSDAMGPFVLESRVEGASVHALVEGWGRWGAGVPPRLIAHLAHAAATALAEVHALADEGGPLELVHGDLGPSHVIMGPLGEARFVDFGAARFRGMDARLSSGDRGTLPYVAPEVARGEALPSQAGDVYALAATLLFLATGAPIAEANSEGALLLQIGEHGVSRERFEQASGLEPRARQALKDALALEPQARIKSARSLADALG
jgi:serine/threonine protein kinase